MLGQKLYVSVTQPDGGFLVRGMASHVKALDVFRDFRDARPGGKAQFVLLSGHDARLKVRPAAIGLFDAEVIGRAARERTLFGLLPATPEIALRSDTVRAEEIETMIGALYGLNRSAFRALVEREIAR